MRIVIMGTGPFAVPSSERLLREGYEIALVVVRPSAAAVGKKSLVTPVQNWAAEAGLAIYAPASINTPESLERLRDAQADLFFVCDYGQILSDACLGTARLGGINLHGSLLPRHRGAAPVQWTLLQGDSLAGVSVIHMTPGLDAGPVLTTRSVSVLAGENAEELESRLSTLGCEAMIEAVQLLGQWDGASLIGQVQDTSLATKAPRLQKSHGRLDFSLPAIELERRVRGYQPWPGAYAELVYSETKRLVIHVRAAEAVAASGQDSPRAIGGAWLTLPQELGLPPAKQPVMAVQTGDGWLAIHSVQPAGKRVMSAGEFLRGHPLPSVAHFAQALPERG